MRDSRYTLLCWTLLASPGSLPLLDHRHPSVHRLYRHNGHRCMDRLDNGYNITAETNTGHRTGSNRRNCTITIAALLATNIINPYLHLTYTAKIPLYFCSKQHLAIFQRSVVVLGSARTLRTTANTQTKSIKNNSTTTLLDEKRFKTNFLLAPTNPE
jgi:hypothetical protein